MGMDIRARIAELRRWVAARSRTFDLFGDYIKAVYKRWNDYFWNALIIAPIVLWWMLGNPPVWLVVSAFVWALLVAGYFAWREEHLKNVSDDFRCWIYAMTVSGDETAALLGDQSTNLFIGLRIVNVGPQTSIHTWQGGYRIHGRGIGFADQFFHRGEFEKLPDLIGGSNLHDDIRLFSQGETREGWVAIPAGDNPDFNVIREIMDTVSLAFTDAFDHFHEVSVSQELRRKSQ